MSLSIAFTATQAFSSGISSPQRELIKTFSTSEETQLLSIDPDRAVVVRHRVYKYSIVAYDLYSNFGDFLGRTIPRSAIQAVAIGDLFSDAQDHGVEALEAKVTRSLQLWRVYDDGEYQDEIRCEVTVNFAPHDQTQNPRGLVLVGTADQDVCSGHQ
jgi:hypothetical protein